MTPLGIKSATFWLVTQCQSLYISGNVWISLNKLAGGNNLLDVFLVSI